MPWMEVGTLDRIEKEGVIRFDNGGKTYAVYRSANDEIFCSDGLCSHEAVHLADGMLIDYEIECPKHSGIFDIRTGEAKRLPACVDLKTYEARVDDGRVMINVA